MTVSQAESSEAIAFCLTNAGNGSIFASPFGAAASKANQYIIDVNESEVVEVYRSFVGVEEGRRIIRRARMYYVPMLYVDGVAYSKSEDFVAHAAEIFRSAKKFLLREADGQYYGPEARELKSMGEVKFVI